MALDMLVTPATKADLRDIACILYDGYAKEITMINYYPPGRPEKEVFMEVFAAGLGEKWEAYTDEDDGLLMTKACLQGSGKVIGLACWSTARQWRSDCQSPPTLETYSTDAAVAFGKIRDAECILENNMVEWKTRKDLYPDGKQHWFLYDCVVLPQYQNQGVGMALVQHGLSLASSDPSFSGPPCVLLATTSTGGSFFRHLGFRDVGEVWKRCKYIEEGALGEIEEVDDAVWKWRYRHGLMLWVGSSVSFGLTASRDKGSLQPLHAKPSGEVGGTLKYDQVHMPANDEVTVNFMSATDLYDFAKTYFAAYSQNFDAINLYPLSKRPLNDKLHQMMADSHAERWVGGEQPRGEVWLKACLKGSTTPVGFAVWYTAQEWKDTYSLFPEAHPSGPAQAALREIMDGEFVAEYEVATWTERRALFPDGAPHWFLVDLFVHPDSQHKGVGKALIHDGFARIRADPAFTTGSFYTMLQPAPPAYNWYINLGFKEVATKVPYKFGRYMAPGVVGEIEEVADGDGDGRWKYKYRYPMMVKVEK